MTRPEFDKFVNTIPSWCNCYWEPRGWVIDMRVIKLNMSVSAMLDFRTIDVEAARKAVEALGQAAARVWPEHADELSLAFGRVVESA